MMNRRRQSLVRKQRGFVLIALVALLVMGGLYFFISNLSPEVIEAQRQEKTSAALVQAREALIGYAVRFREEQLKTGNSGVVYGHLPLPDLGNTRNNNIGCTEEGCDAALALPPGSVALNYTVIGRFPWRTLGTGPLRDSNGECLWYAVSGSHQRAVQTSPMNWDTLSHLEIRIANGTAAMISAINSAHDQPIAVIFSPGPPLTDQDRSASATDSVTECGGNYLVTNYLDPVVDTSLGGITNYLAGTNSASGDTSAANKALSANSIVNRRSDATLWGGNCPPNDPAPCAVVANDTGVSVTSELLFRTLRGSSFFRTDINTMLDRMVGCLRDEIIAAGGSLATPYAKVAGADNNTCYGTGMDPLGYYPSYKEMIFVAAPGTVTATVDGVAQSCAGALLFAGQRDTATLRCPVATPTAIQNRTPGAEQLDACNYLEDDSMHDGSATLTDNNLTSFTGSGTTFAGPSRFAQVSTSHPAHQDIVRCIPSTASFVTAPSALPPGAALSQYNPATRTLTLGRVNVESDQGYAGSSLFGCAWTPEAPATGSGLRSYFKFNIYDGGDGFVFAAVDGDRNSTSVCGAGEQHLGYSGNNGTANSPILYPKIGLEFDTRLNFRSNPPFIPDGFNPERITSTFPVTFRTLANGRADPNYAGGHIGLVYWGGETPISTSDGTSNTCTVTTDCLSPAFCDAGVCKLNQEEDDNVHGQLPVAPASRAPPRNPPLPPPATAVGTSPTAPPSPPPYPPYGIDKLDPSLSSVPTNKDIHVRVEIARTYAGRDDNSRLARVVASANRAGLSGLLPSIDGVTLAAGDTVLVTGQTIVKDNGVYVAAAGAWARAANADEAADLAPGTSWFIKEGTTYGGSLWRLKNLEPPVLNTSGIVISLFRQAVKAAATANLALTALQTVDGVALAAGDRVLLTGQTDPTENGVYLAAAGAWSRAAPEDTAAGLKDGATWFSTSGTGSYWRLSGDATPGTSAITITQLSFPSNDVYFATVTTQVWKLADSVTVANQIARMKTTTRSMNQLDPVVRHAACLVGNTCPASSPDGQSCGGVETDGFRYCYTGQKPSLYDSKKIFDIRGTTSCASSASCSGNQFCGIDKVCYQAALRTTRLGFTGSQSTQSQVIGISDFFSTWLP
jgi:type II secretory pathway pseudopilin PulG